MKTARTNLKNRITLKAQYRTLWFARLCCWLVFPKARRLLFSNSILAADKNLKIFNITEMGVKRSQITVVN